MRRTLLALTLALSAMGCTAREGFVVHCDDQAPFPGPECIDAGSDAEAPDAGADGSSLQDGEDTQATCSGRCVPEPIDNLGAWSRTPVLLWMGPAEIVQAMSCNDEWIKTLTGGDELFEMFRLYKD